ncbi:MAG: FlgD immunoglobulin-like domain containing protein [Candidatus Zixiibacteriota bacterium]
MTGTGRKTSFRSCLSIATAAILLIAVMVNSAAALPPRFMPRISSAAAYENYDLLTFYDANNLFMFVTNSGSIAMDQTLLFGRPEGLYYPYTGDTSDIRSGVLDRTVVYAAGLVLAGKVDGQVRSAVAIYDNPEFIPGSMAGGSYQPYQESFKVFKIDQNSAPGDFDYDNWPDSLGAPVDIDGNPLLIGDQTLWTVFNDADPGLHDNYYGGGTAPLGIEVQQTVWGYDTPEEENFLYLKYKFYNKSPNVIDSFYINLWADPDIGGANDDLIGCDTAHDIFFGFNGDIYSYVYDTIPAAWGGKVVAGPVVESPGDTALFDGVVMPDYKNIRMSSFIGYMNGTEPDSPEELFLYARGWDGFKGVPYVNPFTGDTVTYYACDDPLSRRGYIDYEQGDKRLMVGFGPFTFNPGDSQQVVFKLAAYAEKDNFFSLSVLRHLLDSNIAIDSVMDTIDFVSADSAQIIIESSGLDRVTFYPLKERWLSAYSWGGNFYYGGADYATEFFGSALDFNVVPDSFHSVEVRFSNTVKQKAYRYDKGSESAYTYAGYYDVPFTVWDIDNDRQLNAAFVEYYLSDVYDSTWSPGLVDDKGGWEWLVIFNSDYSGENPVNAGGVDYTSMSLLDNPDSLDILYFFWPALIEPDDMLRLKDGQKLIFAGQFLNPTGPVDTLQFPTVEIGSSIEQPIAVKSYSDGPSLLGLEVSDPGAFQLSSTELRFIENDIARISLTFTPYREGEYFEYLFVIDSITNKVINTVSLYGKTHLYTAVTGEETLLPKRFMLSQNYPNPFNPITTLEYSLPARAHVQLDIFNILGQKVKTLVDADRPAGVYRIVWDGTDHSGSIVASGIYFYRMEAGEHIETKKMLLIK